MPCERLAAAINAAGLSLRQVSEALGLPYSRLRAFLAMAEGRTDGTGYARPVADDVDVWVAELAAELERRADAVVKAGGM